MNPYWGAHFFHFFSILFRRLMTGEVASPAADEVQLGVLSLVALSCGLIGPFLVLKRMAMFSNSLSHTALLGIAASYLIASFAWGGTLFDLSTLLFGALISSFLTAFLTEGLTRLFRLQEDASIGLVFTALFALGITLVTLYTRNLHLGVELVMGNADVLTFSDFSLPTFVAFLNGALIFFFYRRFQICSFDPPFSKSLGIFTGFFHHLLLFMASMTCIAGFRVVGLVLVLAFLVGPYLTARLFFHRLRSLLFWCPVFGIGASWIGVALSRHILSQFDLPLSTGGVVALVVGALYFLGKTMKLFTLRRESDIVKSN